MRYETGSITYSQIRSWPGLQGRLAKMNWTKVAERVRTLVSSSVTVLGCHDSGGLVEAARELLSSDPTLVVHSLSVSQVLRDEATAATGTCCWFCRSARGLRKWPRP